MRGFSHWLAAEFSPPMLMWKLLTSVTALARSAGVRLSKVRVWEARTFVAADRAGEKHRQQHHQEQPQRRNLRRPVALEIGPGQAGGVAEQVGQGVPHPSIEMQQPFEGLGDELQGRAVEVLPQLAALMTPRPLEGCRAVGAGRANGHDMLLAPAEAEKPAQRVCDSRLYLLRHPVPAIALPRRRKRAAASTSSA